METNLDLRGFQNARILRTSERGGHSHSQRRKPIGFHRPESPAGGGL